MKYVYYTKSIFLTLLISIINAGCGSGGSTVGNGLVSIENTSYSNTAGFINDLYGSVSEFKFCVTKLQLKDSTGQSVTKNGSASIEAVLGLINASNANATTSWGEVNIPVGFTLGEMIIEVHHDSENCSGADYSAIYNGTKLTKDLEFKFAFNPAVSISSGDTLKLGLTSIAAAFEQASQQGKLNNEQIGEFLTSNTKGTGSK